MFAGIQAARGDVIVLLDGDLQNDPADIPRLLSEIDRGAAVGVRICSWKDAAWGGDVRTGREAGSDFRSQSVAATMRASSRLAVIQRRRVVVKSLVNCATGRGSVETRKWRVESKRRSQDIGNTRGSGHR
jgi:glycosyltransferase involved in cell wall biosynthesis